AIGYRRTNASIPPASSRLYQDRIDLPKRLPCLSLDPGALRYTRVSSRPISSLYLCGDTNALCILVALGSGERPARKGSPAREHPRSPVVRRRWFGTAVTRRASRLRRESISAGCRLPAIRAPTNCCEHIETRRHHVPSGSEGHAARRRALS